MNYNIDLRRAVKSEEFKNKILALGGYTLENPGEIIPLD